MIDAHTHLYSDRFRDDLDRVVRRARKKLSAVVVSAVDAPSLERSLDIQRRYPDFIRVTAGFHPRTAAGLTASERRELWRAIASVRDRVVAVGEVGPDFHHARTAAERQRQLDLLDEALSRAESWSLPLVVHARRAEKAAMEVLSRSRVRVMFHCFAGSRQMAEEIAARGFYISFSAILLFDPALGQAAAAIPKELILVETDSPALSPRNDRPRNEPAHLESIVTRLAKLLGESFEKTASTTEENTRRFFSL